MSIKNNIPTIYYQIYSPTLKAPVFTPTPNIEEALEKLESLIIEDHWKPKSLCIGSYKQKDLIPLYYRHTRTYARIATVLSPIVKRKLRKLRRKLLKEEMKKEDQQSKLDFLVNFILGSRIYDIQGSLLDQELEKTLNFLRKKDYSEKIINKMISRASNKYRFGFEVSRLNRKIIITKSKEENNTDQR